MKSRKVIVLLLVLVPVLVVGGVFVRNRLVGPVGWAQADARKLLAQRMKDPDSMVIRSSFVVQRAGAAGLTEISVCGVVDGKNGFGGYTGGQRFATLSFHHEQLRTFDTRAVAIEDPVERSEAERSGRLSPFAKAYWNTMCVDANHPPLQP